MSLHRRYLNFLNGLLVNKTGKTGVVLVTSSFVTFLLLELFSLLGIYHNAYFGLITYLALPTMFLVGLILIPISWFLLTRSTGKSSQEILTARFGEDATQSRFSGSSIFRVVLIFTILNVIFLMTASLRTLHFMESSEFCGTACHTVMNPEWTVYQKSPHAHVQCVDCHVGEGIGALVDSKLNGVRQMISATFDLYSKPIPTPVHQLRPARETCEKCHWPEKFYGSKLKQIIHFDIDEHTTPAYTTLNMKIDIGPDGNDGIHWHVSSLQEVRYGSTDPQRLKMAWVEVEDENGNIKRWQNKRISENSEVHEERIMDCIDCHNRATHIYENLTDALDKRLAKGEINPELPYIKHIAMSALDHDYKDEIEAEAGIRQNVAGIIDQKVLPITFQEQEDLIEQLLNLYNLNNHPEMGVTWGSYADHRGHKGNSGCFRCHNENLVSDDGQHISSDCTLCHSILAWDSPEPFEFLNVPDTTKGGYDMHNYLRQEFLGK